jgi:hypothetical protein
MATFCSCFLKNKPFYNLHWVGFFGSPQCENSPPKFKKNKIKMILSGFSPPKFGQLPTKNEGGVGVGVGRGRRGEGTLICYGKNVPKSPYFREKKVKIARLDVLRVRFSRKQFLLSSLTYIQIWISKNPLVDD